MPYRVTDSQKIQSITPAGNPTSFYRVWLVTEKGASGYVDVPAEKWKKDVLEATLQEFADELDLAFFVSAEK